LFLLSFFTVVPVALDDVSFFTVVSVADDDGCSFFTVVSVVAKFSKPFGGAFGGFGNAHEGGALVFALSCFGSDFGGKGGGSGLGIALASMFFFLILSATSSTISTMTSFLNFLGLAFLVRSIGRQ